MSSTPLYQRIARTIRAINNNCKRDGKELWYARHCDTLQSYQEELPSGSGFDSGCKIRQTVAQNAFCVDVAFHHMDEHGWYDGWSKHSVTVTADLAFGFEIKIKTTEPNDHADDLFLDFLGESIHYALEQCK